MIAEVAIVYLQTLAMYKEQLGEEHPDVATSLHNLAGLYGSLGRYEEAEQRFLQALAIGKLTLPPDHPNIKSVLKSIERLKKKSQ